MYESATVHGTGSTAENVRSPSLVRLRTVLAALVVADRRQLLLQSMLTKCTRSQRYVGLSWWSVYGASE